MGEVARVDDFWKNIQVGKACLDYVDILAMSILVNGYYKDPMPGWPFHFFDGENISAKQSF